MKETDDSILQADSHCEQCNFRYENYTEN